MFNTVIEFKNRYFLFYKFQIIIKNTSQLAGGSFKQINQQIQHKIDA